MGRLFYYPGHTVKGIAKFGFWFCLVIAAIAFIAGASILFSIVESYDSLSWAIVLATEPSGLSLYTWGIRAYFGKTLCRIALYAALASVGSIPMYAFGSLVQDIAVIKYKLQQGKEQ